MIVSITVGRKESKGFINKNSYKINNKPMMCYPLIASRDCSLVDHTFFSSDGKDLLKIASSLGVETMHRPDYLAADEALCEDVFVDCYTNIINLYPDEEVELIVIMFANAVGITSSMITDMIKEMRRVPYADSIATMSPYNMFSPSRARVIDSPYFIYRGKPTQNICSIQICEPHNFEVIEKSTCDRNSTGDIWFYDCCCAVVRPKCINNIKTGLLPQKWLGQIIIPYTKNRDIPALDIDFLYQVPQMKMWLDKYYKGE